MDKIKDYLKKHNKFIIIGIVLFFLLIAVIFGVVFSFYRIQGRVYDIDSIGVNIDKIKIGDTINYTANGYNDWKVYSINREDNTIDIVSTSFVEDLTIKVEDVDNYYDILQNTANKYVTGEYAISARSVDESDVDNLDIENGFWINKKIDDVLYYSNGNVQLRDDTSTIMGLSGYLMPIVTIGVSDSTGLSVGNIYNYSLNGVDEWIILYVNDSTSISIVPKNPISFTLTYADIPNFTSYLNNVIEKFKDDNVINVRNLSLSDEKNFCSIARNKYTSQNFYVSDVLSEPYESRLQGVIDFYTLQDNYTFTYLTGGYGCRTFNTNKSFDTGWRGGFVPIVTLKYSAAEKNSKDINDSVKVGDYVKYSANGYNNWKVLSIDKENNTIDIISGGVVKNITLEGKEDYENLDFVLQEEVDKYKNGDNVINARSVSINDFDNLEIMNDILPVKFFLNNRKQYRDNKSNSIFYSCAVGSYDSSITTMKYEWAILADKNLAITESAINSYSYTAGIRPIITMKLQDAKKSNNSVNNNNSKIINEQNKANQFAKDTVTNEDLVNVEIIEEKDSSNADLKKNIDKLVYVVGNLEDSLNELETKYHLLGIFIVLLAGICGFTLIYFIRKSR